MKTKFTIDIDNQTAELVTLYAKEKGLSINELFEYYIRLLILNEQISKSTTIDLNNLFEAGEENVALKKTNWIELDQKLSPIRQGLPTDYKFDRDLANER